MWYCLNMENNTMKTLKIYNNILLILCILGILGILGSITLHMLGVIGVYTSLLCTVPSMWVMCKMGSERDRLKSLR